MSTNAVPGQAVGDQIAQSTSGTGAPAETNTWIKLAKDAYSKSTTYFENNYFKQFEDGLRLFNSQHPRDSKYNSDSYKYRSRIFRPKTRSVVRKHEATAAMAFFSNPDVLSVDPVDSESDEQIISAAVNKELLQHRLTCGPKNGIQWFLTTIGAFQDAMNVGICASFQYWDYQSKEEEVEKEAEVFGMKFKIKQKVRKVLVDKPCCELIPVQNIRFDPAAKWYDVVGTSPYLILQLPMYLRDVLDRMENGYGKDDQKWKSLPEQTILTARVTDADRVQQAREGRKEDPQQLRSTVNEFDVVMVHLNFIKTEDGVFTYYTLKDQHLLSDPRPIEEVFLHGEVPVTIGFCIIETHTALPKGLVQLGSGLQQEANEICNQRLDNVKFVLNKRWIVRRGSNIDVESMLRNVPGGVTMANDTEKDIREINWADVTASSFQEQDRLNADLDGLMGGGMDSSSVMTNRKLNETVGGMRLMAQGQNALTEYTLRVFVESWAEPTLRQLVKLEQYYESDETILAIAAQRAGVYQKLRQNPDLDRLLKQDLNLTVNIGMGATDPEARFQRFMQAMGAYSQLSQAAPPDAALPEIRKELFGLAGFKDSKRFFTKVDPRWAQAQQMLAKAEQIANEVVTQHKDRILRGQMQLERKSNQLDLRELEMSSGEQDSQNKLITDLIDLKHKHALERDQHEFDKGMDIQRTRHDQALSVDKAEHSKRIDRFKAAVDAKVKEYMARNKAQQRPSETSH